MPREERRASPIAHRFGFFGVGRQPDEGLDQAIGIAEPDGQPAASLADPLYVSDSGASQAVSTGASSPIKGVGT